jgi:hypothetical protein
MTTTKTREVRARENRAYVRELLRERQPGYAALLRAVERQLDRERFSDHQYDDQEAMT